MITALVISISKDVKVTAVWFCLFFLGEDFVCCDGLVCFFLTAAITFMCDKRCNKKRSCGRHKCNEVCCVVSSCVACWSV